jgi:hypothetical protein
MDHIGVCGRFRYSDLKEALWLWDLNGAELR